MNNSKKKTLILYNSVPYFFNYLKSDGVKVNWVLREISFSLRIIRKITLWLKLSQVYWYDKWKNDLESIDLVIIFAPLRELGVFKFIKKSKPNIRIIYWYWNPIFRVGKLDEKRLNGIELWSFDPEDCEKFKMKFNTTFYFKDISYPENKIEFDAIFVGNDKGRRPLLKNLESKLNSMGLKTLFHIISDNKDASEEQPQKIPYQDYLKLISKSKTIIDILPEGQSGLTLRPMEAIFLRKKLITSDQSLYNQDFYSKHNIFILGKDEEFHLKRFINSNYIPIDDEIVNRYDSKEWLKRFIEL